MKHFYAEVLKKDKKLAKRLARVLGMQIKAYPKIPFSVRDDILDGLTYEELLYTMVSNYPEEKLSKRTVKKLFKELLKFRVEDAEYEFNSNIDGILKYLKTLYSMK